MKPHGHKSGPFPGCCIRVFSILSSISCFIRTAKRISWFQLKNILYVLVFIFTMYLVAIFTRVHFYYDFKKWDIIIISPFLTIYRTIDLYNRQTRADIATQETVKCWPDSDCGPAAEHLRCATSFVFSSLAFFSESPAFISQSQLTDSVIRYSLYQGLAINIATTVRAYREIRGDNIGDGRDGTDVREQERRGSVKHNLWSISQENMDTARHITTTVDISDDYIELAHY